MASQPPPKKAPPAKKNAPAPVQAKPLPTQPLPAGAAAPAQPSGGADDQFEESEGGSGRFILFNAVPSWLVSTMVHVILIIMLALVGFKDEIQKQVVDLVTPQEEKQEELEEFELTEIQELDVTTFESVANPDSITQPQMTDTPIEDVHLSDEIDAAPITIDEMVDFSERHAPKGDLLNELGAMEGTGVSGRGAAARGNLVKKNGGNDASEAAVAKALKWLAEHQLPDGSWSFDHRTGACQGRCDHAGTLTEGRNGATAMALLPFLGAGQTHMEGKYKANVKAGLAYLLSSQKAKPGGGSWEEPGGSMYSHGLASITICEAYAMTHDKGLIAPAQAAINYIVYAQDPVGGGWRYQPKQAGDTSAVGWQLMALKSGHMGYLQVPPNTIRGTMKFLDSVQEDSGSFYGYTGPGKGQATTAVGLLCRMYLGWDHENPALERGVQWLSQTGPSGPGGKGKGNMYYNYYATQVMRHYEGETWDKWNIALRDWLVSEQSNEGHMTGSWHMTGDHGADRGGRLYCTSMATMILEVYYRHMPIYGKAAAKEDFPL